MKRYLSAALAAALLAPGFWAVRARAQDEGSAPPPPPQDGGPSAPQDGSQPGGQPDAAPRDGDRPADDQGSDGAARPLPPRLKRHLGLTDDQAAKFQDANKAHREAMMPLGKQMREAMKTLREQLRNKASDDDVQKALDALRSARKAIADENERHEGTLASFLTPTQRARLVVDMEQRMRMLRGEPGGRGGWGGGRDRGDRGGHGDDGGDRDGNQ